MAHFSITVRGSNFGTSTLAHNEECPDFALGPGIHAVRARMLLSKTRDCTNLISLALLGNGYHVPLLPVITLPITLAEGEFFRNAICSACEVLRLSVLRVWEREIENVANTSLGRSAAAVMKQIANAGKSLGSPWTQDQKKAALAAWMALHEHKGGTLISRRWRR